jgi:hypothetical protein
VPTDLSSFKRNSYSQGGEDGVLHKIFLDLDISPGRFCEFGAWDGKHLSNTYALYEAGWKGCYIEADPVRYQHLLRTFESSDAVTCICAFVEITGENSLEALLERADFPVHELNVLSVDIDSDDLGVWRSLTVRPTVVVIEYNPTMPIDVAFQNPPGTSIGNSARAIMTFADSRQYDLVAVTTTNLIFVTREANAGKWRTIDATDPDLRTGNRYFFGYDGTVIQMELESESIRTDPIMRVPWSGALFAQPIKPRFRVYRKTARTRRAIGRAIAATTVAVTSPIAFLSFARGRRAGRR